MQKALYSIGFSFLLLIISCSPQTDNNGANWAVYRGNNEAMQYSSASEITPENVKNLTVAWEYHAGGKSENNRSQIQFNSLIIDGILYGTSPNLTVFALDAASGKELWSSRLDLEHNPGMEAKRGITYWENGDDRRLIYTHGKIIVALNASNGEMVSEFGDGGKVSMLEGLDLSSPDQFVAATSPGIIFGDIFILGSRVSEGPGGAPGHIRAFNVKTGKLEWVFHTIPKPGQPGYETWPEDAWKTVGGANSWAGMSLDTKRGIVYIPTGSAAFDFYGGNRKGENLYANCILALDAKTGKYIWHYQTVHHDVWDRDLPCAPNLVTIEKDGKMVDALAQITKSGFVFVLDRETGEPLFPIEEKEYPQSDLQGEETWPTQPLPLKPAPFARQRFDRSDITDISEEAHAYVDSIFQHIRSDGQFIPPSVEGTVVFPGFDGGGEWGGAAYDPESSTLYVNANEMPWILTMKPVERDTNEVINPGKILYERNCASCHGIERKGDVAGTFPSLVNVKDRITIDSAMNQLNTGKGFMPSFKQLKEVEKKAILAYVFEIEQDMKEPVGDLTTGEIPYTFTGYNRFLDQNGYPAIKPPWGTLNAINLNTGEFVWKVNLGELPELTEKGMAPTGTENYGGPAVTKGGLVFIAATKDEMFRAFDKNTGELLWETKLPAGGYATPSVYSVNGKQYVVIAAGGGKMGTPSGDSYLCFTLPTEAK
ncbi:MAG: PQQ-binding-like beta-propeller repeat protein [Cyclobacteriaceae bacterium]|nr:PQQ-binding-like beta-propeller repeat protein [Cyclobacteriaceae bacterium]